MSRAGGFYDFEGPVLPHPTCRRCGAVVADIEMHNRWHDGMCDHRDRETGLRCTNPFPCNGPHRSAASEHTW